MARQSVKGIIKIVSWLLVPILRAVSPLIEEELEKFMVKLYKKAVETENPLDDLLVGFLLDMLDINRPE